MSKLTLSMIVKNEEKHLRDCLISVKDVVDEIVLVDTGSTDNTIKIAEEYGANIYNFPWVNDFSAARNFALGKSTGDWILYLDADERLDHNSVAEIKKILENNAPLACYCTVKSYDSDGSRDNSLRYPRLFKNSVEIKFTGKVHEQIEPSLTKNKYHLFNSNILIHHLGYNISKEEKDRKAHRNLSLLIEDYNQQKTAYGAFQIGQSYNVLDERENAYKYFKIAGESVDLDRTLRAQCFASMSLMAHNDQKIVDAERYVQFSIKLDDRQPFSQLLASKIALRRGDYLTAEFRCRAAYQLNQNILTGKEQTSLTVILDPEEVIYFGLTLALQNKNSTNISFYQKELSVYYNRKECENGVLRLTVIQKLFNNGILNVGEEKIFIEMANRHTINLFLYTILSNPNKQQIFRLANDLQKKFPDSLEVKKIIARLLEDFGKLDEAIQLLENVVEKDQFDPAILFYLISFYLKKGSDAKIKPLIGKLEKNYAHIPEVMERVRKLRRKLLMLTSVPL
ncbi:hypothetical protein C0389_09125 [bacterium]|nr:hypothetical protein [bacterium]